MLPVFAKQDVGVSNSRMPQGKSRVSRDGLLKKSKTVSNRLCRPFVEQVTATQVEIVCFRVISRRFRKVFCFGTAQLQLKRNGDFLSYLALQSKNILLA